VIGVGEKAPEFDLPVLVGGVKQRFRLGEQRGKNIILAFYPFNWEAVTIEQFTKYQMAHEKLRESNADIVGISVESIMNTTAWEREIGPFDFPLCSDFWPHGAVCRSYGVLRSEEPDRGASERAIFVVATDGNLAFRRLYGLHEVPGIAELLECLRRLRAA
jgi:peroxiredoxin